jgi:predicted  nucleic acid-binding Zn-ribbon protein
MDEELKQILETMRQESAVMRQESAEMRQEFASLRQEFASMRQETAGEFAGVRQDFGSMRQEFASLRQETAGEFASVRQEFAAESTETRRLFEVFTEDLKSQIQTVAEGVLSCNERIDRLDQKVDGLSDEMATEFKDTRSLIEFSHHELDRRVRKLEDDSSVH